MQTIVRHVLEESEDTSGVTSVQLYRVNCFQKCHMNSLFYLHHLLYGSDFIYYQKFYCDLSREHFDGRELVCWFRVKYKWGQMRIFPWLKSSQGLRRVLINIMLIRSSPTWASPQIVPYQLKLDPNRISSCSKHGRGTWFRQSLLQHLKTLKCLPLLFQRDNKPSQLHHWLYSLSPLGPPVCHSTSHTHTSQQVCPSKFLWLSLIHILPFFSLKIWEGASVNWVGKKGYAINSSQNNTFVLSHNIGTRCLSLL